VLDTAVLVSAIRSSSGAAAEVIRLAARGKITLLVDYKLVCEYREVTLRPEHVRASAKSGEEIEAVIEMLESIAIPVFVGLKYRPLSRDPNDDMVLDIAINGRADAIVTNNVRDFGSARQFGIQVLAPRELLDVLRKGESNRAD